MNSPFDNKQQPVVVKFVCSSGTSYRATSSGFQSTADPSSVAAFSAFLRQPLSKQKSDTAKMFQSCHIITTVTIVPASIFTVATPCISIVLYSVLHCVSKMTLMSHIITSITHQLIWVLFGRDVAERLCYQTVICYPTSPY